MLFTTTTPLWFDIFAILYILTTTFNNSFYINTIIKILTCTLIFYSIEFLGTLGNFEIITLFTTFEYYSKFLAFCFMIPCCIYICAIPIIHQMIYTENADADHCLIVVFSIIFGCMLGVTLIQFGAFFDCFTYLNIIMILLLRI